MFLYTPKKEIVELVSSENKQSNLILARQYSPGLLFAQEIFLRHYPTTHFKSDFKASKIPVNGILLDSKLFNETIIS